jgi:predicted  nucleic acid-binding Zn-ribbon protein
MELKYHTAVSENRKLQKKLKENKSSLAPANSAEVTKLQNELNEMSKRYNELEEKFLDLKLQS